VCRASAARAFVTANDRRYFRCDACEATFLDAAQLPSIDEERAVYGTHQNDPKDAGYRRFLDKLATPLLARLPPHSHGLDYGCGPGPALAAMLREAGHSVALWDPFFAPDASVLAQTYDFVTCTETAEHFHAPADELDRLATLVRPGGLLAIMTCFQDDDTAFAAWHYRRDPTHVVFYKERTLRRIAERYGWRCEIPVKDVALFTR
jgi:SAM-dependent methyltransferase